MAKRILILGGGVSGLSLAHFLSKRFGKAVRMVVAERNQAVGGKIWTETLTGKTGTAYLFEKGPRSLLPRNGLQTMKLIEDLGIEHQVLAANEAAEKRYILRESGLMLMPPWRNPAELWKLGTAGFKELFILKTEDEDESIDDFMTRRMGSYVAHNYFEPVVLGIWGGNTTKLSMKSCFPDSWNWEQDEGGFMRHMLFHRKTNSNSDHSDFIQNLEKTALYSFHGGLKTFGNALQTQLLESGVSLMVNSNVSELEMCEDSVRVKLNEDYETFDHVFSTLPSWELADILRNTNQNEQDEQDFSNKEELLAELESITHATLAIVNVGYNSPNNNSSPDDSQDTQDRINNSNRDQNRTNSLLKYEGFGFLVPSLLKRDILGMTFDSSTFPSHNHRRSDTRISVLIGGDRRRDLWDISEQKAEEIALESVKEYLKIQEEPDAVHATVVHKAIPQYYVGHSGKIKKIEELSKPLENCFTILGSSLYGVSINNCIASSHRFAQNTKIKL